MKQKDFLRFSLALLCYFINATAYSYSFVSDGIYYNILSEQASVEVTYCSYWKNQSDNNDTYSGKITIPSNVTYDGITYTVVKIGDSAFYNCMNLEEVHFPNSITAIGERAFLHCIALNDFDLPTSLQEIGHEAFIACESITKLYIPNNVVSIGDGTFSECVNLSTLKFAEDINLQKIGVTTFSLCTKLESIEFPNSVTTIDRGAFLGCDALKRVIIPNNVSFIGNGAFQSCKQLEELYIPGSIKTIETKCFSGCINLKNIRIENGVETIKSEAFYYNTNNIIVILPPSIKTIEEYNFYPTCNLVFTNGNVTFNPCNNSTYYILDANTPVIMGANSSAMFYVYDKNTFINYAASNNSTLSASMLSKQTFQLNDGLENRTFNYTGYPQGPNRNGMKWEIGERLKEFGLTYEFKGNEHTDCGEWNGSETVEFKYKDWTFSCPILYDYKILPVALSLSVPDVERMYGDDNPQFEIKADGFVGNDNINNALENIVITTNATKSSEVGSYPINISAKAKNYDITIAKSNITIAKAPLSVKVNDITIPYGTAIPKYTLTYEGFKLNDSETDAFSQIPTIESEISVMQDAGSYLLNAKGGIAKNYEITEYKAGNLTITKAPLTLTVNDVERYYYSDNPAFDYTLTGLVNDDDESCITITPSYSCLANISSDCGQYTITPFGAYAKNYNITYKEGMLNILPLLLTLIPIDAARFYGDANADFSFVGEGLKGDDTIENALTRTPNITTQAIESSVVGEYPITIAGGEAKNYTLAYELGKLSVLKAPLRVTALDSSRMYGQPNPQFALSVEGLKFGERQEDVFSEMPTATTAATIKSDVGVYPLTVNGGVARNYEITEYVPGNLTITKAPLTLSANNAERLYHTDNPDFGFTLTGLVNDDDRSCLSKAPEFTCAATLTSGCGDYEIIPSNAEAQNYDISYNKGKMTVIKSPLSISVADVSREYGDPNPRFEFIYSGFKDGDDATSLSVLPKATCIARPNSPVGYYDIEVSGAESQNYDISYTPGILTVNAAPLTIRAKDAKRTFGTENPEFEISYFGFKNEDDESSLFRLPQVSTSANAQSPVGNYPIVVSDAAAKNYTIIYEQGVLTIAKGTLIARVKNASRIYGEDNPQFQVEYSGFLNGDSESVISIKPQIYTEANRTSKVGTYAILASGASSSNYDFDYQNGELVVNPREISASVGNYTRPYGTSNPQFEIEYNGFVNGDDKTSITTPPIATCEANLQSNVGSYTISLSGGQGENYIVSSFTNGILTIEKANQSIEWNQDLSALNQYDQIGLTATSTSGLPVDYEVANNSVIDIYNSGGKTYIDCYGTGTVTIRATQSGNENYYPAEIVTNRVTVVGEGGSVDPSSHEISINDNTAGTLSSRINVSKKYQIKSLTVSGFLNGTDIRYIREMAGRGVNGTETNGILEKLNLSRATIVSGGEYYYTTSTYTSGRRYTSDNQISDYMFYGCSTLTNLTLPQNCTKIGDHTFDGCLNLTTIIMPDDIESIGAYAFNGDISLSRISVPENTVSIGNYAFQNCIGLNTLILGSSVKSIGNGMLNGCLNIQEITLNNDNEYFSTLNGVLYNKAKSSLIIYPAGKQFQTFEIPDGVTEIKNSGFYEVVALKYLFLPESLTSVGLDAFKGCSNLSKLYARPTTPPTCANDCFDAVSKSNCALYVPRGSHNSYWVAPVWGDFLKIEESNDLSVGGNIAKPDYGFEFTETTLNKGKFTYIPVSMNNVDPVVAFNCEIVLPEGVAFYKDSNEQIVFKQSERFPLSQNINSNLLPNGVLRVISTSSTNEAFSGTEGVLFYLPLLLTDTNANEDSEYNLIVKDIEFTKKNQSGYSSVQSPDITVSLTVGEYNMGDANGDGRITGADAVLAMSYFLGKNTPNIILKAADMNYDGKITSIDVVLITDELLAQNQSPKALTKGVSNYYGNLLVSGTPSISSDVAFNISVPSAYKFTAIQMDVTIPDGYNIKSMEVASDNKATHIVRYYQHPNGMTRIFISSDNNADFTSDNILYIELEEENSIHSSQEIFVEDVLAVEISDDEILEWNVCGSMTNISELSITPENNVDDDILIWVENSTIYIKSSKDGVIYLCDISGRSRSIEINAGITSISVVPGIYLINHKKIIVK